MSTSPFRDVKERIAFCFTPPTERPKNHHRNGLFSVLYLLRRELIETAGYDPNVDTEAEVDARGVRTRLFVSLVATFTAFDLLAKFSRGDTERVGDRFVKFLRSENSVGLSKHESELYYAIRCSLVHAFGMPDGKGLRKLGLEGVGLRQRTTLPGGSLVAVERTAEGPSVAFVYIDGVFTAFHSTLENLNAALLRGEGLERFEAMFDKYGTIHMG